jgi:ornithine cyclodeaminase/alanine dehydrogenase
MKEAKRSGIEFMHKLASLGQLIGEQRVARESPEDIVLYKSVGSALQDVVIAEMLLARARARGIGTVLAASIEPVAK